ncbi:MAG: hypothetical protein IT381_19985 [Deltaproteobacteria bacterium]|nr:hypothetical protein [Deltaproteobacteria bacterium]
MLRSATFAFFLVALVAAATQRADATMVIFRSDEELFDESSIIVQGVVWRRTALFAANGMPRTEYEIEAVECFKGCKKGQWIVAHAPGINFETEDGESAPVVGSPVLEPGDRVIAYLSRAQGGAYVPLSLGLSIYKLHYHPVLKRFIARRQVDNLTVINNDAPTRDENGEVAVTRDRFAGELTETLRAQATKRGRR